MNKQHNSFISSIIFLRQSPLKSNAFTPTPSRLRLCAHAFMPMPKRLRATSCMDVCTTERLHANTPDNYTLMFWMSEQCLNEQTDQACIDKLIVCMPKSLNEQ